MRIGNPGDDFIRDDINIININTLVVFTSQQLIDSLFIEQKTFAV